MNIKSSYNSTIDYGEIFNTIILLIQPTKVVEFGILEGFSLDRFVHQCSDQCIIEAYDIFDDFNGNHANYHHICDKYSKYKNVTIGKLNFYESIEKFRENSINIIHIDIANDKETYQFAIEYYFPKIRHGGAMILEGGSTERDEVYWMNKYNKPKIYPYLNHLKKIGYQLITVGMLPSLTIIYKP